MKQTNLIDSAMREEFEYYLLDWATYFRTKLLVGNLDDGIKLMMGDNKEDFNKKLVDFEESRNVLSYLENLKKFGKRAVTSIEIVSAFKDEISERSVHKQLQRLKHWKQVEEIKTTIRKKPLILYRVF